MHLRNWLHLQDKNGLEEWDWFWESLSTMKRKETRSWKPPNQGLGNGSFMTIDPPGDWLVPEILRGLWVVNALI